MVPGLKYFRINPIDSRCGMDLDCTDQEQWKALEQAAEEYAQSNERVFAEVAQSLISNNK